MDLDKDESNILFSDEDKNDQLFSESSTSSSESYKTFKIFKNKNKYCLIVLFFLVLICVTIFLWFYLKKKN